jgi:putative Mn2+ efflux pump MntP
MIAIGLSMDAFAVSVCKGLNAKKHCLKTGIITGLYFGGFQALMPTLGYICGGAIRQYITMISKYVALILLGLIGINMIIESLKNECEKTDTSLGPSSMIPAAVATSIDAFAVGITLAALNVQIVQSALLIGATTFLISFAGAGIGHYFGDKFERQASIAGGAILILIGLRIFLTG